MFTFWRNTFWAGDKSIPEWALKEAEAKYVSHIYDHEYKNKYLLPVTLKCHPFGLKYPLCTGLEVSMNKGKYSYSWENIWKNKIWTVLRYLMLITVPFSVLISLSKNVRKRCILWVNWQRCTTQVELLLQTVQTGQSAWHDPLQGSR